MSLHLSSSYRVDLKSLCAVVAITCQALTSEIALSIFRLSVWSTACAYTNKQTHKPTQNDLSFTSRPAYLLQKPAECKRKRWAREEEIRAQVSTERNPKK